MWFTPSILLYLVFALSSQGGLVAMSVRSAESTNAHALERGCFVASECGDLIKYADGFLRVPVELADAVEAAKWEPNPDLSTLLPVRPGMPNSRT